MKIIKLISRIVLGFVFTFSGFVKAIDPIGSEIKFTDYFIAFDLFAFSSVALSLAIIISSLEFIVGISLLFNVKPKLSSIGALLFMIIFTPLTFYISIANPVSDCGCFGDVLIISNWQTFGKNVILLILSIYLFIYTKNKESNFNIKTEYAFIIVSILLIIGFQIYNIRHLPIIDFRPYSEGTYIPDKMIIPEGAKQDSSITYLYYEKNGKTKKFLMDEIPWQDTTWEWKKTETEVIEKGYEPPIHDFNMYKFSFNTKKLTKQNNIINTVLKEKSYSFLIIAPDLSNSNKDDFKLLKELINSKKKYMYKVYFLTASISQDIKMFNETTNLGIDFYITDILTLKTMIRANPGLILLKEGVVIKKWHNNDFPNISDIKSILKIKQN